MRDFFYLGEDRRLKLRSDREPAINAPFLVLVLIGLLVGIHIVRGLLASDFDRQLVYSLSFIPVRMSRFDDPVSGIGDVLFLLGPEGRWLTIFAHVILHTDYLQLVLNCIWLLAAGAPVARRIGQGRFLVLFLVCAAAGAGAYYLKDPGNIIPLYGASAACAGMMGAAVRFAFSQPLLGGGGGFSLTWPSRLALPLTPIYDMRVIGFSVLWTILIVGLGLGGTHIFGDGYELAWETYLASFFAGLILLPWFDPHRPSGDA